ncbi:tripartite tricarboxylate transporter TctB family protein [Pseudonocardia sp. CA-142604]|uniref:tripartite tricarboxylate transporter TctB family protein n=1 Tax=Pseudonocardia sp. CA-142604 TaxID=3240024 RepID=UPI003D8DB4DF
MSEGMTNRQTDATTPAPGAVPRTTVLASGAFGALMMLTSVLVIVDAVQLPDTTAVVGPAVVPLPVGVLLGGVGAGLLVDSVTKLREAVPGPPWQSRAGLRVLALVIALILFAVLLPLLGYVVSATALFVAAALLLGAPRGWRVVAYGWALAATVFLIFDRMIGLTLPAGPWGF